MLLRIVNSPFGRVLQAVRENEFRTEALGYRVVAYRTVASVIGALAATVAGALMALWLRYNGPDTTLSFAIMIDILLMVVIGGMGTLYGAVIGAFLFVLAQSYLQVLMGAASGALAGVPRPPEHPASGPVAPVARPDVRDQRLCLSGRDRRAHEAVLASLPLGQLRCLELIPVRGVFRSLSYSGVPRSARRCQKR